MGKRKSHQLMVLEKLDRYMWKRKTYPFLTQYTNITSKWTTDLNVIPERIKLLEHNVGGMLFNTGLSTIFFKSVSTSKGNKSKNKQIWQHKTKRLFIVKEAIYETKW